MILPIVFGIIAGISIVLICYVLAVKFCRWAFAGEKWEPKMRNPPPPPKNKMSFDDYMKAYNRLAKGNQLNDN